MSPPQLPLRFPTPSLIPIRARSRVWNRPPLLPRQHPSLIAIRRRRNEHQCGSLPALEQTRPTPLRPPLCMTMAAILVFFARTETRCGRTTTRCVEWLVLVCCVLFVYASHPTGTQAQGVVPQDEWASFEAALRRPLPISFRINSTFVFANAVRQELQTLVESLRQEQQQREQQATAVASSAAATAVAAAASPPMDLVPRRVSWCEDAWQCTADSTLR